MADRTQRVIWTALPNGVNEAGQMQITALASPRLVALNAPVEPLQEWPDFSSWADKMLQAEFTVFLGGADARAKRVSEPDPDIWKALFADSTPVINHAFEDRRGDRILSYPVARVHDFVGAVYGDLGISVEDELPEKRDLLRPVITLVREEVRDTDLQSAVLERLHPKTDREGLKDVPGAFVLQEVYNMPLASTDPAAGQHVNQGPDDPRTNAVWRQHKFERLPDANDFRDQIDFHAIVSALNQYPHLLRLTGLAVDLVVEADALPDGPLTDALSLKVAWEPDASGAVDTLDDGLPRTMTRREDRAFHAVPRQNNGILSNGFLNIDDERYRLIQMDVDGAGVKLRNAARSFLRAPSTKEGQAPDRAGIPTIRTAGLQLVEVDRHLSLEGAFDRSGEMEDALNNGQPIELFAEDIVRGYHADIIDQTTAKPWQSLCRRDSTYDLINTSVSLNIEDEEGMIRLGAQEAADPDDPQFQNLVKIGELVFAWSGWSLTAPRPGLAISTAADDHPDAADSAAPPGLPLETNFAVHPKSLPVLRFGHEYRARVRVADLAGNALPLEEGDAKIPPEASGAHVFRRYEPVPAPSNALVDGAGGLERPDDGESMGRMAIRSFNETEADNTVVTAAEIRRHIVPPRTSQVMAEQHGAIDVDGVPDPGQYPMLASRDDNLAEIDVLHEDPLTNSSDLVKYSVGPEGLSLPYLPDWLARIAVVRLDFDPKEGVTQRFEVPYYEGAGKWPDAAPFKLRIFEQPGEVAGFDASTRSLNVPLDKAEMMRIRISHRLKDADLDLMAIWQTMRTRPGLANDLQANLQERILRGDHWMITPWLEMELVHAVQKPLVRPGFLSLGANRAKGATEATINYRSPVHAKSTAKVELLGRWRDPSDVPAEGPPRVLNQSSSAFDTRLYRDSFPNGELRVVGPHAFGDTRFRRVQYRLEAPTRFPEFMPPAIRQQPDVMKVTSDPGVALIPNASSPPPPEIVEVTPTFGWTRTTNGSRTSSFRSGGGLRVWLKRPWFATGFGEMLGVVIANSSSTKGQITGPLLKYVTQWGIDPIWRSGTINSASPPAGAFPDRLVGGPIPIDRSPQFVPDEERELVPAFAQLKNLFLPESGGARVDVVPHPVNYDPGRGLYYCDIRVRPGSSYYPFIRMALARFHPVSVNSAHLSAVALADYMQIAPDRLLVMTPGTARNERKLQLFGTSYTRSAFKEQRPRSNGEPVVRVEIQTKDPDLSDELAWKRFERIQIDDLVFGVAVETTPASATAMVLSQAQDLRAVATSPALQVDLDQFVHIAPPLIWETTIRVPRRRAGEELRVMVTEYERHMVDSDWDGADKDGSDPALRLVYAETLAL
ncbi:hypothetical protein [uncultured Roseobacter sp.]|uniref:hypothetical protein n=1 Tax=uncultured Roseobacter sp. TaxID=114847 RepID=UPI0026077EB4|nr:hypothetical protein [uncultured Roseobacter sp.]